MTRPAGPTAIVAEELSRDNVPVRSAWVGILRDERKISWAIGKISKLFPETSHLKRCSSRRLVLGFAACAPTAFDGNIPRTYARQEMVDLLGSVDFEMALFENDELVTLDVPSMGARTKIQAKSASRLWPLNFHPDPRLESILDGSFFHTRQLEIIDRYTELCVEAALRGKPRGSLDCHGSAVVYDPASDNVLAIAASRQDLHPMWHASMLAIDLVAKYASGGAYELTGKLPTHANEKNPRLDDRGWTRPLAFPRELVEMARRYEYRDSRPIYTYLCTDYWIFLLREPCPMCAMALLHSRVSNIFYGVENKTRGVLGSRALLHDLPGLNHRYGVWKTPRRDECLAAFVKIQRAQEIQE